MSGCGRVLVTHVAEHDTVKSVRKYFQRSRHVSVKNVRKTEHSFVVTFSSFLAAWSVATQESQNLDDHHLKVQLLQPNVYGSEVTIEPGHVEVNVGSEVLNKIARDEKRGKEFERKISSKSGKMWWRLPGHLGATCLSSKQWPHWEKYIMDTLVKLLQPFEHLLLANSQKELAGSDTDRLFTKTQPGPADEESSGKPRHEKLPSTEASGVGDIEMFFPFGSLFFRSGLFVKELEKNYPEIQISSRNGDIIRLSGPGNTRSARDHICRCAERLSEESFSIASSLTMMFREEDGQKYVQQILDKAEIPCHWKITGTSITVIAFSSDHEQLRQIFRTCFRETVIHVLPSQLPMLLHGAWKKVTKEPQKKSLGKPAPKFKVVNSKVIIVDLPSNIDATRYAVIAFFYKNMLHGNAQLCRQQVTKSITDLKPWQVKYFSSPKAVQNLSEASALLQKESTLHMREATLSVTAPMHLINSCLSDIWRYIASLSQQTITLSKAVSEMYKNPTAKTYTQSIAEKTGLLCHLEVDEERIVIIARDTDQYRLKQAIWSAFTEVRVTVPAGMSVADLRSGKWYSFVRRQEARSSRLATPGPAFLPSPAGDCVIVVDTPEHIPVSRPAVESFFRDKKVQRLSQEEQKVKVAGEAKCQAGCKEVQVGDEKQQIEEVEIQTKIRLLEQKLQNSDDEQLKDEQLQAKQTKLQTEDKGLQTEFKQLEEIQIQKEERQLQSKQLQTEETKPQTQEKQLQTEERQLQNKQLQTEETKLQTQEKELQTEKRQLHSKQLQTEETKQQTEEKELQTEERQLQNKQLQTEETKLQTEEKELQTEQRKLHSKQLQTEETKPQTQEQQLQTEKRQLETKQLQTDETKLQTQEKELQTEQRQLHSKQLQTEETKPQTQEKQLQTEERQLQNKQLQTEETKLQTEEKELQTEQRQLHSKQLQTEETKPQTEEKELQTEERQLQNKQLQTEETELQTQEQQLQTEKRQLQTKQLQTDETKLQTQEKELQTEKRQLHSKQLQTEETKPQTGEKEQQTEERQLQSKQQQTEKTKLQTQEKELQTEGSRLENKQLQTEESKLQTREKESQTEDLKFLTNEMGQQTEFQADRHIQTEDRQLRTEEGQLQTERRQTQTEERQLQTRERQSQTNDSQLQAQEVRLQTEESQQTKDLRENVQQQRREDEAKIEQSEERFSDRTFESMVDETCQTFPKTISGSQNETENEAPEEVPVDSCVWQQQLSRLNVRQLLDVSTHMDVSQQVLQHLESSAPDVDTLKASVIEQCVAVGDANALFTAIVSLLTRGASPSRDLKASAESGRSSPEPESPHTSQTAGNDTNTPCTAETRDNTSITCQCVEPAVCGRASSTPFFEDPEAPHPSSSVSEPESSCFSRMPQIPIQPLNTVDPVSLHRLTHTDLSAFAGSLATLQLPTTDENKTEMPSSYKGDGAMVARFSLSCAEAPAPQTHPSPEHEAVQFQGTGAPGHRAHSGQARLGQQEDEICQQTENARRRNQQQRQRDIETYTEMERSTSQGRRYTHRMSAQTPDTTEGHVGETQAQGIQQSHGLFREPQVRRHASLPDVNEAHLHQRFLRLEHEVTQSLSQMEARISQNCPSLSQMEARISQNCPRLSQMEARISQNCQSLSQMEARISQNCQGLYQMDARINQNCQNLSQMEARISHIFLQRECLMHDRMDALLQYCLQSAGIAESRVYLRLVQALRMETQKVREDTEAQMSHNHAVLEGKIAEAVREVQRQINMEVQDTIRVDNASDSSSSPTPSTQSV